MKYYHLMLKKILIKKNLRKTILICISIGKGTSSRKFSNWIRDRLGRFLFYWNHQLIKFEEKRFRIDKNYLSNLWMCVLKFSKAFCRKKNSVKNVRNKAFCNLYKYFWKIRYSFNTDMKHCISEIPHKLSNDVHRVIMIFYWFYGC